MEAKYGLPIEDLHTSKWASNVLTSLSIQPPWALCYDNLLFCHGSGTTSAYLQVYSAMEGKKVYVLP